jgi:hypothetical protein
MLMTSCTTLTRTGSVLEATDCVNGTLLPRVFLPTHSANYTVIHGLFQKYGRMFAMDRSGDKIPFDTDITIYNRTKASFSEKKMATSL